MSEFHKLPGVLINNNSYGIGRGYADNYNNFINNTFNFNGGWGVWLTVNSRYNNFIGNDFSFNVMSRRGASGFSIDSSCTYSNIINNTANDNSFNDVYYQGSGFVIGSRYNNISGNSNF